MTTTPGGSRSRLRKTLGFAAILIGLFVSMFGLAANPAGAFEGGCTPVDANSGTCVLDETSGNDPNVWGTMTYSRVGDVITFTFNTPDPITSLLACFNVTAPYPTSGQSCTGGDSPQYNGGPVDPLVINLAAPPTGNLIPGFDPGDPVFFAIHVNQGGRTTYGLGGAGGLPAPTGSLSVDKAVTGNDQPAAGTLFSFTVDCLDNGNAVDLNGGAAGTQASFTLTAAQAAEVLDDIPTGSVCTVTETNAQNADSTSMSVNGGAPTAGNSVGGVVIGDGTTVTVLATNTFNTTPPPPPPPPPPPVVVNPPVVTPPVVAPEVVTPPVVTPPVVAPEVVTPPAPPTEVAGVVIPQQLPRTGSTTLPLLQIGFGLILLGAGALLFGRERTALI